MIGWYHFHNPSPFLISEILVMQSSISSVFSLGLWSPLAAREVENELVSSHELALSTEHEFAYCLKQSFLSISAKLPHS